MAVATSGDAPRWLIAVSGGADSVALLRGCLELRLARPLQLHVVHVDHQLRTDSGADAEWIAALCAEHNVPLSLERPTCDLRTLGIGIEEAAREARYSAFQRVARDTGSDWVLVAHTADDQAETVLHHITRGTGLKGLAGIPATRPLADRITLWRPLLTLRRSDLRDDLAAWGQSFRSDSTNDDLTLTRNRLRHRVIPLLEQEFNPRVVEALSRLSEQAAEVHEWLAAQARMHLLAATIDTTPELVRLKRTALAGLLPIVLRECFVQLWTEHGWPRQAMTAAHWNSLCELTSDPDFTARDFPEGASVRHRGELLVIAGRAG